MTRIKVFRSKLGGRRKGRKWGASIPGDGIHLANTVKYLARGVASHIFFRIEDRKAVIVYQEANELHVSAAAVLELETRYPLSPEERSQFEEEFEAALRELMTPATDEASTKPGEMARELFNRWQAEAGSTEAPQGGGA